ncbi:MAG: hypothetical protein GIW99_10220 [Candidatus Eremiobacteraeota bacterium]|nr:hypothetical protein [Candidatus Eremiobacteraeota bacterium]MBC5828036.1 hypothetical protein [Candidatus Eremiobacteraeota bacterium]
MSNNGRYAEGTSVPEYQSQMELQRVIARFGADQYVYGEGPGMVQVGFRARNRLVRFYLPMPVKSSRYGDPYNTLTGVERERRRRWRCLILLVKGKLTAVEDGIASFDTEFLPHMVTPNGRTIGEELVPQLDAMMASGRVPALMPGIPE